MKKTLDEVLATGQVALFIHKDKEGLTLESPYGSDGATMTFDWDDVELVMALHEPTTYVWLWDRLVQTVAANEASS